MDYVGGDRFQLSETVLKSAADNAKTVIALQEGVSSLEKAASAQERHIAQILETAEHGMASIEAFAADAERVAGAVESMARSAVTGKDRIAPFVADIAVMADQIAASAGFLKNLRGVVETIGKTADAIKDIAEELSIVAINTAIEAARAGDRGRGFAVIAREVRKLAERSGSLTENIARDLAEARKRMDGVDAAVSAAETSSRSAKLTSRAFMDAFTAIAEESDTTNGLIAGFKDLAERRLAAERRVVEQVRSIADESKAVVVQSDEVAALSENLRTSTRQSLEALGSIKTGRHEQALREADALAQKLRGIDIADRKAVDRILEASFAADGVFELLYLMDAAGDQISDNIVNPAYAGKIDTAGYGVNRAGKPYFSEPRKTGEAYLSPAYLSSASGSLCITVAIPLKDAAGRLKAVLAADVDAGGMNNR